MRDITSCKLNFEKSNTAPLYQEIGFILFYRKIEYRLRFIEKSNTDLMNREIEYRPDYREIEYRPVLSRNRHYPDESRKRDRAISFLFDN